MATDWAALYGHGTNPVCAGYQGISDTQPCGCDRCGHPLGEHARRDGR